MNLRRKPVAMLDYRGAMSTESGLAMLRDAGLVMQAAFDVAALPDWALDPMAVGGIEVTDYQSLVMLGHGGTALWDYIAEHGSRSPDPFDSTSASLCADFVNQFLGSPAWVIVYPGELHLPLGRLAELAGWGKPSPLGLTINDSYGLWIAHRAVFLVDYPVVVPPRPPFGHPCDSCVDKPCIAACPADAVSAAAGFDVVSCSEERVLPESDCAFKCLARNACPVGVEHRYGPDQMRYHYAAGLAAIERYRDSAASS